MSKIQSKKIAMIIVCMLLISSIILPPSFSINAATAAVKPSIAATAKIGTGSIYGNNDYFSKTDDKYVLTVSNPVKNATYSFTSSNTKILTVKASGTKVYLTGVVAGTATITCNQKLNGKTTKVGTCKVTVMNSTLYENFAPELAIGTQTLALAEYNYRNNDAVYTYVSDSKNFSIVETFSTFDGMQFIKQTYTAKAAGTYNITIKETYNKKTRVVGKLKFVVKNPSVEKNYTLEMRTETDPFDIMNNPKIGVNYLFVSQDSSIVGIATKGLNVNLIAMKVGTTKVKVYEGTKTVDASKLIGTCTITVKEVELDELYYDLSETEVYVDDDPITVEVSKSPKNAPGTIEVISSNPKVAKVSTIEDGVFEITPVSAGTVTITIKCGDITETETITVIDEDDEDDEDDE